MNLEEPLIKQIPNKEFEITSQKSLQPFNDEINPLLITKKNLTDLFLPDNIRDGVSYKIITSLNGIGSILNQLKTNINTGITVKNHEELEERKKKYGKNDPVIKPLKSLWFFIQESLQDFMLRVLIVAAIVALIVGMIEEGVEKGWMEGRNFEEFFFSFIMALFTLHIRICVQFIYFLRKIYFKKKKIN